MEDKMRKQAEETIVALVDTGLAYFGIVSGATAIYAMRNTATEIAEQAFLRKLERFFGKVEKISEKDKARFGQELAEGKRPFFEKIILVLDRLDEEDKADVAGNLFKTAILEQIDKPTLNRLLDVVNRTYWQDLVYFRDHFKGEEDVPSTTRATGIGNFESTPVEIGLLSVGLVRDQRSTIGITVNSHFYITPLGKMLLKYGFHK